MRAAKTRPDVLEAVERKLLDGTYDRALEAFEAQIDEAAAALRRCHEAMKSDTKLRS